MDINTFFTDLDKYIRDNVTPLSQGWSIYYTIPKELDKSIVINIIDGERSNETKVNKLTVEFFMSYVDYTALASLAENLRSNINLVRGLFPTVGQSARTFCQPIIPVKPGKDIATGYKLTDGLCHLSFIAEFYIEEGV